MLGGIRSLPPSPPPITPVVCPTQNLTGVSARASASVQALIWDLRAAVCVCVSLDTCLGACPG